MDNLGCTSPVFTNQYHKVCDVGKFNKSKTSKYRSLFKNLNVNALSNCPMPCSTMDINFGYPILDSNNPNEAYVKLYFKSSVNVRRNIVAYSETSLFAEIGGYIGLLLGFSLLDLTKLVKNLFTCANAKITNGSPNNQKHIETVPVEKL